MLVKGILNPGLNSLLSRIRHTNTLVIADRGFAYCPGIETIDLSLTDDIPTVLQVLAAIRANFVIGEARMAEEFASNNRAETVALFDRALAPLTVIREPHATTFRARVAHAIGLVRTGDTIPYANMILTST